MKMILIREGYGGEKSSLHHWAHRRRKKAQLARNSETDKTPNWQETAKQITGGEYDDWSPMKDLTDENHTDTRIWRGKIQSPSLASQKKKKKNAQLARNSETDDWSPTKFDVRRWWIKCKKKQF